MEQTKKERRVVAASPKLQRVVTCASAYAGALVELVREEEQLAVGDCTCAVAARHEDDADFAAGVMEDACNHAGVFMGMAPDQASWETAGLKEANDECRWPTGCEEWCAGIPPSTNSEEK